MPPYLVLALTVATIHVGPCPYVPTALGCAGADNVVYVKEDSPSWVKNHELGHIFDFNFMSEKNRNQFKRIINRRNEQWIDQDFLDSPSELFADSFASCVLNEKKIVRSTMLYSLQGFSNHQHRRVCRLLRTVTSSTQFLG